MPMARPPVAGTPTRDDALAYIAQRAPNQKASEHQIAGIMAYLSQMSGRPSQLANPERVGMPPSVNPARSTSATPPSGVVPPSRPSAPTRSGPNFSDVGRPEAPPITRMPQATPSASLPPPTNAVMPSPVAPPAPVTPDVRPFTDTWQYLQDLSESYGDDYLWSGAEEANTNDPLLNWLVRSMHERGVYGF